MIGQYLSNTNENATVSILQNFLQLNKALALRKDFFYFFGAQIFSVALPQYQQLNIKFGALL